ncbi:MAG: Calx-beta domain-containing protein [Lysobacter sp.]
MASGTLSATYAGVTRTTLFTVNASAPPTLSVGDAAINEGSSGTQSLTFTIQLSHASTTAVTYGIATADGSALAGSDYVGSTLTEQTIAAGQTSKTFAVTINGDMVRERSETFTVDVSTITGSTLLDGQAVGTIVNDDAPPKSTPHPPLLLPTAGAQASDAVAVVPVRSFGIPACGRQLHAWRIGDARACFWQMSMQWLRAIDRLRTYVDRKEP